MCWWCGNDNCTDGEKCRHARSQSPLLNSNTYRSANRRIENATGQRVARAPGVPWGGRRPAFVPGIRDAMMRISDGICPLCRTAISGEAQVDHTTPWKPYIEQSARTAMQEHGQSWTGGSMPDDFVRVMSSDPNNLQVTHARCNQSKSNSMPGLSIRAVRQGNRKARRQEADDREKKKQRRILKQQAERDARAERWDRRWDGHDSDQDFGGAGILV